MTEALVLALIKALGPLVLDGIRAWQQRNQTTELPTGAQLDADIDGHAQLYLGEGRAWKATHPETT